MAAPKDKFCFTTGSCRPDLLGRDGIDLEDIDGSGPDDLS
jgi:hypothetical protein